MLDVILFTLAVLLVYWLFLNRPRGLPPTPGPALPLLGHLHLLGTDPRNQFEVWRRRFGDVFGLYMGQRFVLVLNGYEAIKDALVKQADVFSARPQMFVTELVTRKGIVFNSGPRWKEQRKVSIEILLALGMGKTNFSRSIETEVSDFVKSVGDRQGQASDLSHMLSVSVSNNICSLVFGRRFAYDNADFLKYLSLIRENFRHLASTKLLNYLPWLSILPGDLFHAKKIFANIAEMQQCFLKPQIQRHIDQFFNDAEDDDCHEDFIRYYLKQIKKKQLQGDLSSNINEENLLWTVSDLFVAGTETLTSTLLWTLAYLIHNPEIQSKCFQQINDVIGMTSSPSIHHRTALTYVEATIMEVLRIADVGAMSLPHGVSHGVEFHSHHIPRDAIVIPFLHSVLNDPEVWEDPGTFRPERFLDTSGSLLKKKEFIPFSIGRRACPGEQLARQQLFLYVTSLIQRFRLLPPEDGSLPSLKGIMSFTHFPLPFCIRAVPRDE